MAAQSVRRARRDCADSSRLPSRVACVRSFIAYIAGQRQALQEVLEFMQAMLDHSGNQAGPANSHSLPAGSGASGALGQVDGSRLINFICVSAEPLARLEHKVRRLTGTMLKSHAKTGTPGGSQGRRGRLRRGRGLGTRFRLNGGPSTTSCLCCSCRTDKLATEHAVRDSLRRRHSSRLADAPDRTDRPPHCSCEHERSFHFVGTSISDFVLGVLTALHALDCLPFPTNFEPRSDRAATRRTLALCPSCVSFSTRTDTPFLTPGRQSSKPTRSTLTSAPRPPSPPPDAQLEPIQWRLSGR